MAKKVISALVIFAMLFAVVSMSVSASAVYEDGVLYGDVNGDKKVDTNDAKAVLKVVAGMETIDDVAAFERADINCDGEITLFDARQILRGASGTLHLQPSGAFNGFECQDGINLTEETVVAMFNTYLNRIKTEENGYAVSFIKTEDDQLTGFEMGEVEFIGINFGSASSAVASLIQDIIVSEDDELVTTNINNGSQNYSLMSIEGSPYVSKLSVGDLHGVKASYNKESGELTLKVALADTEIEGVTQSAYSKVLNTEIMLDETNSTLVKLLDSDAVDAEMLREFRNCVLTLVLDGANGDVISYKIEYESEMYISDATVKTNSFSGLAKAKDVRFSKTHSIEYTDFQWETAQ